jgi:ligand-binding SRPBCC domain-containing protein
MMKIVLKSKVKGNFRSVFKAFDQNLFEYLLPKGARLNRFDGSKPGDIVDLQFEFPLKGHWVSKITEAREMDDRCFFVDVGEKLPFGLKNWHHKHLIRKLDEEHSVIEDHMEFTTGNKLMDLFYYPGLYIAFFPRVSQYKRYFR